MGGRGSPVSQNFQLCPNFARNGVNDSPRVSTERPFPFATIRRPTGGTLPFSFSRKLVADPFLPAHLAAEPEPLGLPGPRPLFAGFFPAPDPRGRPGPRRG